MSCLSLALGVFQKPEADPLAKTNTYVTIAWNYRISKNNKTLPAFNIKCWHLLTTLAGCPHIWLKFDYIFVKIHQAVS